jgi:hypothetical protein
VADPGTPVRETCELRIGTSTHRRSGANTFQGSDAQKILSPWFMDTQPAVLMTIRREIA